VSVIVVARCAKHEEKQGGSFDENSNNAGKGKVLCVAHGSYFLRAHCEYPDNFRNTRAVQPPSLKSRVKLRFGLDRGTWSTHAYSSCT
jgi:hypothetical protein